MLYSLYKLIDVVQRVMIVDNIIMDEIIIFTRSKHRILGEIVGIDSFQRGNRLAKYLVNNPSFHLFRIFSCSL